MELGIIIILVIINIVAIIAISIGYARIVWLEKSNRTHKNNIEGIWSDLRSLESYRKRTEQDIKTIQSRLPVQKKK